MERAVAFLKERFSAPVEDVEEKEEVSKYILSGTNWKSIRSGQEYTFCFMYIELDNRQKLKGVFSAEKLEQVNQEFHDYIQRQVDPLLGKIWMWVDFYGLVLFPFDGEKCDAILKALC
jgi:hypothetical protein